jgi:membrane-bound ClpP family serine protease
VSRLKRGGPTFWPALIILVVAGATLFLAEVTWLQATMAVFLLVGIALAVFAVATPEFLEGDAED